MSLHSVLVLIRGAWELASPGIVLHMDANQGSLGTRLALGLYTPHWCSPGEPKMRLAQGLGLYTPHWCSPGELGMRVT